MTDRPDKIPPQSQSQQPGIEAEMHPQPEDEGKGYKPAGKPVAKSTLPEEWRAIVQALMA